MRYHHTSWNDIDRALEAFKYARRSLLVVMAVALPFAAWEAIAEAKVAKAGEAAEVQTVKQVELKPQVQLIDGLLDEACGRQVTVTRVADATV